MGNRYINRKHAKSDEYGQVLDEIIETGQCPFCPEYFKYHKKPVLKERGNWLITESSWPYPGSEYHYLIVSKVHKETINDLTSEDLVSVHGLSQWISKEKKIPGGALIIRIGDTEYTGATVAHLHFHLISPGKKDGKVQVVNFPIG